MHGFSSGFTFLINAEVDFMGGVIDGGVGIGTKLSPCKASTEKAQIELRLEYDVREERRRELEFLEKGADPLDFKFGHAATVSVLSTSHTDQHLDQFLTSEAKGSFALTASPHGYSVESSGRLGVTTAGEPNSADNFDGENEQLDCERKFTHLGRGSITPSEHSSQLDGSQNVTEQEESPIFHLKKGQAYRRRNWSRSIRDCPRSCSADMALSGGCGPSLPSHQGFVSKTLASENQVEIELDDTLAPRPSTNSRVSEFPGSKPGLSTSKNEQKELQEERVRSDEALFFASGAEPGVVAGNEDKIPVDAECSTYSGAGKTERTNPAVHLNESGMMNGIGKCTQIEGLLRTAVQTRKDLDSEPSFTQTINSIDRNGNTDAELCTNVKHINSSGAIKKHELSPREKSHSKHENMPNEEHIVGAMESGHSIAEGQNFTGHQGDGVADKHLEDIDKRKSSPVDEVKNLPHDGVQELNNYIDTKPEIQAALIGDSVPRAEISFPLRLPSSANLIHHEFERTNVVALPDLQPQPCGEDQLKQVDKAHEESILEEARIIRAKHKRIAELSVDLFPRDYRRKSHWDFVLEEMAWLANDFAQERLWRMTAATQICHRVASASRSRLEEQHKCLKHKSVAHTIAKAVMGFWHSAWLSVGNVNSVKLEECIDYVSADELEVAGVGDLNKGKTSKQELLSCGWKHALAVHGYAVRFLQSSCSSTPLTKIEIPGTLAVESDMNLSEVSLQDQLTEENLFYAVPPGAMVTYRKSIESCLAVSEKIGNNMVEVYTSMYDAAAEFGYQENDYEEAEGENVYYLSGTFDTGKLSKKKRKNTKSSAVRSHESLDFGYGHCMENRNGTLQPSLMGKKSSNSFHVGPIHTKRIRTASRQRVMGSFNAGVVLAPSRTDVSSGDTNFIQDDYSHGGAIVLKGFEIDSAMTLEKQSTFDSAEIAGKPKKRKKIKHQDSTYDPRWQLESAMPNEQMDHLKKRSDSCQFDSNGNSGLFGQHAKKSKIMKQSLDSVFDNIMPMSESVASPEVSQMSNMSNQNKIIKLIGGRDKSKKAKALKGPAGQSGSGSPWSLFEDQALVVLVHDMGPNWELVSDAVNNTLQFKCIFRKPLECKERHNTLMHRTSSDRADSAEDSGSYQPYPSTLPGIPKGSARQLFQCLQGPMEEKTIKSHIEKIILIGSRLHYCNKLNDKQDQKQILPVHGSHVVALSQVIPNNVNGGILTPLDLCEGASNEDELNASHQGGLALPNQGAFPPMHLPSGLSASLQGAQGSSSMGTGNNVATSSQFTNPLDARLLGLRPGSLPAEEHQRLHPYNHMLSGRNIQQGSLPSSGALSGTDRGAHMLLGGNGVSMMSGMNRSISMPRPALPRISSSPSMLNSGGGLPSNMNMHSGAAAGHGNSRLRPHDALQMVQGIQAYNSGVPHFGRLNSGFSAQVGSPSIQSYSGHHQQQHSTPQQHARILSSSHHQNLSASNHSATTEQAMLRIREKQIQQRLQGQQLQQHCHQHQQLPASNAQLPLSPSVQGTSQLQSQASPQPVSLPPSSPLTHVSFQQQPKHPLVPPNGQGCDAHSTTSGMTNQAGIGKQRQRQRLAQQQYQQSGKQHPQQHQQSQSQQQPKFLKGMGRTNMLMHQNLPIDSSHLNDTSANPEVQLADKGEQPIHSTQSQGLHSESTLNTMQQSKPLVFPQFLGQSQCQKSNANTIRSVTKLVHQMPCHLNSSNQSQIPTVPSAHEASSDQSVSPTATPSPRHQQLQEQVKPSRKGSNKSQRVIQKSRQQSFQVTSDPLTKSQADHASAEHHFVNSIFNGNASGMPATCVDSANVIPQSSSSSIAACKVQDTLCDSAPSLSTSSGPIGSLVLTNSLINESLPSVNQDQVQQQLSVNLIPCGHIVGSEWQQQKSQL